jgi:hypothetical protein
MWQQNDACGILSAHLYHKKASAFAEAFSFLVLKLYTPKKAGNPSPFHGEDGVLRGFFSFGHQEFT